jgi:uncharacterized membrane protein YgaE (UPF0421/DUF939 family)
MWAVVATVFVFRDTRDQSLSAGISRMIATCVSFALCLAYLLFLPFNPVGVAALVGIGTLCTILLDRRNEIVTTGITTAVVMVVAALSPAEDLASAAATPALYCSQRYRRSYVCLDRFVVLQQME